MNLTHTLMALAAMTYTTSAATLAVNFMRNGSTTPAANDGSEYAISTWIDIDANAGSPAMADGVTVSWAAGGTWSGGGNNVENGYIDNSTTMTISGLTAWLATNGDDQYTIQFINAQDTASGFFDTELRDTTSTGTVLGTLTNANISRGATDVSAQLTTDILFVDSQASGSGRSGVAGIIITSSLVPEPSSTTLLGLGGLALLMRRKK